MEQENINTISIELKAIEDLFVEPDFNPFDFESRFQSGIDELVDQIRELSLKKPLRIRLNFSKRPDDGAIDENVQSALRRYCSVKIRECEREICDLRSQGKRDLIWALTLSFIFFLGAFFVYQLPFIPEVLIYLLSTGFGLLAWVVLWPPLDNLLYEWKPCRRSQQFYKYIQSAELVID
jgi:hypothetical protein